MLESESPADRDAQRQVYLADMRERNRRFRADARAAGTVPVQIDLQKQIVDELDAIKRRAGLRSRSQAFARVMAVLAANPKLKQELGL